VLSNQVAGRRTVHCGDGLAWLEERGVCEASSFVTSLPDVSEMPGLSIDDYRSWFTRSAARVLAACPPDGVAIFYQTDVVRRGVWLDKGYLAGKAAEQLGCATLWHRIVLRDARPGYTHMLCFSRDVRRSATATTDVLLDAGATSWTRGMGLHACAAACRFVLEATSSRTIVDPFCGRGTVLAVANELGLDAVGVEICRRRAQKARSLRLDPETLSR